MSLFRSEEMGYYTILMPREHAWEVLNQLGELNALQFVDLNADQPVFNKPYANFVKRCDEMETKIEIILKEMERFKKETTKCDNVETFLHNLKKFLTQRQKAERTYFDEVENELNERLKSLLEQVRIRDTLIEKYDHLVEYRQVLFRAYSFVSGSGTAAHDMSINSDRAARDEERKLDLSFRGSENIRFTYLAGVIDKEDSLRFKRILFRMTRGMVWTTLMDIDRPQTEAEKNDFDHLIDTSSETKLKTVFLIVYQGGSHEMMAGKLNKICDSFGASKYGLPADRTSYDRKLVEVEAQLKEAKSVISVTEKHIDMILEYFAKPRSPNLQYSLIEELKLFVVKEKVIYDNLNKLKSQNTLYRGCCWCTSRNVPRVYDTIAQLKASSRSAIGGCEFQEIARPADATPPTHFETNEVTWVFQEIVNTYGIPRYREINPGLFAIATFPFLFGVMFGDIGHGALLFIFGLYLILFKKSIEDDKNNMVRLLIPARYLLVLQGFFAFYCGLMYNDFMSLTFNIFGTCYSTQADGSVDKEIDCTYPVGVDSSWGGKANELTYMNSFKMKLAIVLGVTQMLFGILMRGWNCINWKNWVDFFCEFIPMLLFMSLTFGYMVVLIFIKWSIPWGTEEYPTSQAPSIIGIFIKMVLEPGKWPKEAGMPLYGDANGEQQAKTQFTFLVIAAICALIILVPKPLILLWKHRKGSFYNLVHHGHDRTMDKRLLTNPEHPELELVQHHSPGHEEEQKDDSQERGLLDRSRSNSSHSFSHLELDEHFEFGEVFVHQVIEAIEFVLGSISSTASYLRLWALSLAHSQLAKVFFDNCIKSSIQSGSIIGLFIGFIIFGQLTLGVLLLMDQMECFLHALRLHWVEFQNKFYKADGHSFAPFSYKRAVAQFVSQ